MSYYGTHCSRLSFVVPFSFMLSYFIVCICCTCHMAYLRISYISLPSLVINFSSDFIKHTWPIQPSRLTTEQTNKRQNLYDTDTQRIVRVLSVARVANVRRARTNILRQHATSYREQHRTSRLQHAAWGHLLCCSSPFLQYYCTYFLSSILHLARATAVYIYIYIYNPQASTVVALAAVWPSELRTRAPINKHTRFLAVGPPLKRAFW